MARICRWRDLERWLPDGATSWEVSCAQLPLGDLLKRRLETVDAEGFASYTPITIHFDGSVVPRDRREAFKGAMFAAYPGDLVYSKIDVRNGAIGLVPDSMGKAVVTAEYPIHTPDAKQVEPKYLALLLRSPNFKALLKSAASGTSGRKRVNAESFEELEIPLPELSEQRALVRAYERALTRAGELEQEAAGIEEGGNREFEAALGLVPPPDLPRRPVQIAWFSDMERWSHEGALQAQLGGGNGVGSRFDSVLLEDVAKVSYGLQKCPRNRPDKHARPYLRVANVQRGYLDLREVKTINVPDGEMPKYALVDGDVLLCEGNSSDLVGRGAIWRGQIADCVHQNHVLRVRVADKGRVLPEFVLEYINSRQGQAYFRSKAKRTTNLSSINSKEVASMPMPLPSTAKEQESVLTALHRERERAAGKRKQAAKLREAARADFLVAIFR